MKKLLLSFTLLLSLVQATITQQPSPAQKPTPTPSPQPERQADAEVVRITTNLVQVDMVVTDKDGKPVTDLRADEVDILEDGKSQKVTNFSFVTAPDQTQPVDKRADKTIPGPPVRLKPHEVRRTIALVVDDLGLSFSSAAYTRNALKKFLDEQMQRDDLVAVIRTGGGIGALQQFTSDKRQLYAAVERVKFNLTGRRGVASFSPIAADPFLRSSAVMETDDEDDLGQLREDLFAVGTLGALNYIVRGLRELPGRKSVVLISDGISIFNRANPEGDRVLQALRRLTDLANRSSVVVYTIDARGLETLGLTAADSTAGMSVDDIEQSLARRREDFFNSQDGLNYLAQQTGGLAIRNTNDINHGLKRILEDQKGFYLIGYRPDDSTFDDRSGRRKFHRLNVKILRPGKFKVRMRNGFYGVSDEEAIAARAAPQQQLIGALTSPFGAADVHVRLTSLFANDAKLGSLMRSFLYIKASDLSFTAEPDGWHKAVFDILAVTFGDNGVPVDSINRTHTVKLRGDTYERVLKDGFTYNLIVPVKKAGAYQLRIALRDVESQRIGSAAQFIEVPDIKKNRLMLSGLTAMAMPADAYSRMVSTPEDRQNSNDTETANDARQSVAVRQFKNGDVMEYGFMIYNAQLDKLTRKPQLTTQIRLFRNGKAMYSGKERSYEPPELPDPKRIVAGGAMKLGNDLPPGEYVLQVIVTDALAKQKHRTSSQWIDFEIVH